MYDEHINPDIMFSSKPKKYKIDDENLKSKECFVSLDQIRTTMKTVNQESTHEPHGAFLYGINNNSCVFPQTAYGGPDRSCINATITKNEIKNTMTSPDQPLLYSTIYNDDSDSDPDEVLATLPSRTRPIQMPSNINFRDVQRVASRWRISSEDAKELMLNFENAQNSPPKQ